MTSNIKKEIVKEIGIINQSGDWNLEVNLVSWNGAPAKIDIRSWSAEHEKCSKGITLTEKEAETLVNLLGSHFKL